MPQRLTVNAMQQSPDLTRKLNELDKLAKKADIAPAIFDLVEIRASQLNGCAFCLDVHVKQASLRGERALRIHHVPAWRDSPLFDARERAALEWTEALTQLGRAGVPDETFARVRAQFDEPQLVALTFAVMTINAWNRLNVAFRTEPGALDQALGLDKAAVN